MWYTPTYVKVVTMCNKCALLCTCTTMHSSWSCVYQNALQLEQQQGSAMQPLINQPQVKPGSLSREPSLLKFTFVFSPPQPPNPHFEANMELGSLGVFPHNYQTSKRCPKLLGAWVDG